MHVHTRIGHCRDCTVEPANFCTPNTRRAHILDFGPNTNVGLHANMLAMNRPISNSMAVPPRRFLLLPEDAADVPGQGFRIRRYRLTSVGRSHGLDRPPAPSAGNVPRVP
jgi:hypothetical protein